MNGPKYLRREVAYTSPVYQLIAEKAAEELDSRGWFSKSQVLKLTSMEALSDSLRWDYLTEMICNEQNVTLVPLAKRFFHQKRGDVQTMRDAQKAITAQTDDEREQAENALKARNISLTRFLAGGHGRNTYGYAIPTAMNGALVNTRLANVKKMANGKAEAFKKYSDACRDQFEREGMPVPPELESDKPGNEPLLPSA
jgi:hypothetical protein